VLVAGHAAACMTCSGLHDMQRRVWLTPGLAAPHGVALCSAAAKADAQHAHHMQSGVGPSDMCGGATCASPSGTLASGRPCSGGCVRWPAGQVPYIAGSCGSCCGAAEATAQTHQHEVRRGVGAQVRSMTSDSCSLSLTVRAVR
jgi:hypothetical protein